MQQLSADSSANGCRAKRSMSSVTATPYASMGTLDLNLLKVLDAIIQERNLTRAGQRLGLSQPATSHALARLRYMLGDELFVRNPEGMQPTPREIGRASCRERV